jgi:hypothetical protein
VSQAIQEKSVKFTTELKEHFKNINLSFKLYPQNEEKTYKSINHFYDFIVKQCDYWNEYTHGNMYQINQHFNSIRSYLEQTESYQLDLNQSIQLLNAAINLVSHNGFPCVFISPEADLLKELYKVEPNQAFAACEYMFSPNNNNQINISFNDKASFEGIIHAFFFKHPNLQNRHFTNIDKSIESMVSNYTDNLNTVNNEYFEKIEEVESSNNNFKNDINDYKESLNNWKESFHQETQTFVNEKEHELQELVNLYEEKLKLEAPAKYWEDASHEYQQKGKNWMWVTVGSTILFIAFLTFLLIYLPNSKNGINFASIKMTIVLTVIITAGLYLINFFIRLSTSSFHLSRDANERHKLTYVYLALLKDKSVEETDRTIILQSLFSRADTGLLKGDSSPTLPDGLLGQVIKMGKP